MYNNTVKMRWENKNVEFRRKRKNSRIHNSE